MYNQEEALVTLTQLAVDYNSEHNMDPMCLCGPIPREALTEYTRQVIVQNVDTIGDLDSIDYYRGLLDAYQMLLTEEYTTYTVYDRGEWDFYLTKE